MRMARSERRGILVLAVLRQGRLPDRVLKALLGVSVWSDIPFVVRWFFWAKALRFGANDGYACGCPNPLESVVVGTFFTLGLRMKTLDHLGLDDGGV
jgi:hypothetical protein